MAFGSFRRGSSEAGVVKLVADTGQFNREVDQAERNWMESMRSMSREALRLQLAEERLERSLHKFGTESAQTKRAVLQLKDAEEAATRSANKLDTAHDRTRRGLISLRSAAAAAAGVGGLYGLAAALRSTFSAAQESEVVLGQTRVALEAAGLEWAQYGDRVEKALRRQSKALAFDDEQLARSFQVFIRQTKDVDEALRRNELAADLARGRYLSLEQATNLVTKAALGQAGALRRVGIDTKGVTDGVQLLRMLTEQYGRAAEKAANTSQAASDRWHVSLENLQETLGEELLPTFTRYIGRLTQYVDRAAESGELQERVNRILSDGEAVVRGLAGGLKVMKAAADPVIKALGGMENAARTLFAVFVISKIAGIATAIRGIGTAAAFSRTQLLMLGRTPVTTGPVVAAGGATTGGGRARGGGIGGLAAVGAGFVLGGQLGLPGGMLTGSERDHILRAQELYRVDKNAGINYARKHGVPMSELDPAFGAAEAIVAPGEGRLTPGAATPTGRRGRASGGANRRVEQAEERDAQDESRHDERVIRIRDARAKRRERALARQAEIEERVARAAARNADRINRAISRSNAAYKARKPARRSPDTRDEMDEARRMLDTAATLRGEFTRVVNEFDSNVHTQGMAPGTAAATGGPQVVTIHQHFKAPTADRHREARLAHLAAKAQFLG